MIQELPVFTELYKIERKLYKLIDFSLPWPVSFLQIGVWALSQLIVWVVLELMGIRFTPADGFVFVCPPIVLARISNKPLMEEKRLHSWLFSQLRHFGEPRTLHRLAETTEPEHVVVLVPVRSTW